MNHIIQGTKVKENTYRYAEINEAVSQPPFVKFVKPPVSKIKRVAPSATCDV